MFTTLALTRLQFAVTISFHILFPAFSIGLATYLVMIEGLWLKTRREAYYQTARFWSRILGLTFGMGIVSGLAMQFQSGTNWGGFSKIVGPVLGVLFTLEALSAFFIEATFLGVMLFGWDRVPRRWHYFATCMVWVGVSLSAFWIMAANSWMHTPAGVTLINGQFAVNHWLDVILNHSTLLRYSHMLLASYLATACVIVSVAATYLMQRRHNAFAKLNIRFGLLAIAMIMPLQILMGDEVGYNVHQYQPVKTAAIEANWETRSGAPLVLFAKINSVNEKNDYAIRIPYIASLLNTHDPHGTLQGLKDTDPSLRPNVTWVFYSFRIMVGAGMLMMLVSWYGCLLMYRGNFWQAKLLHRTLTLFWPLGFIALLTGWYTSEIGRQPWVVYGYLKTSDGVSHISYQHVLLGFGIILLVYGLIFGWGYTHFFMKTFHQGPTAIPHRPAGHIKERT